MQCKELESALERQGLGPFSAEEQEHLSGCSACQGLLADFSEIADAAGALGAEVAPPERIWVSLRAQLEAEGVIREPIVVAEPSRDSWFSRLSAGLRPRSLATAGAGLALVVAAAMLSRPSGPPPATPSVVSQSATVPTQAPELAPSPSESAAVVLRQAESEIPNMQLAGNSAVDASLRDNLRTLNEFIADCEQHLKKNPDDDLAREYLNTAYQQKAELLAAMMESGRSEH